MSRPFPDTQEMQTALLVLAAITAIGWGIFVLTSPSDSGTSAS